MARADSNKAPREIHGSTEDRGSKAIVLREIEHALEFKACEDLQRRVWGADFAGCVPTSLLQVASKTGGIVAGAFDEELLQGFVFGLTALRNGALAHWSHMLAVRPVTRRRGLGTRLKLFQRELLLRRGIEVAYWTFDPLMAPNASLNLTRLGGEVVEYVVDMYGTGTGSRLHGEVATDRLLVRWRLSSDRVTETIDAGETARDVDEELFADVPRAIVVESGEPRCVLPAPTERRIVLSIPPGFERIVDRSPQLAMTWRRVSRRAFQLLLRRGYQVVGFGTSGDDSAAYRLQLVDEPGGGPK